MKSPSGNGTGTGIKAKAAAEKTKALRKMIGNRKKKAGAAKQVEIRMITSLRLSLAHCVFT